MIIPDDVKEIMQKLLDAGYEAYIIGGAVRDDYLGLTPKDYDIFTNATGEEILEIFPKGIVMGGEERQAKILTVIVNGHEVSQYRSNPERTETGGDSFAHIQTCDFTINSIMCNIDGEIHDHYDGRNHLGRRVLHCVGNASDRIAEDKLRALRAIRFACKYDLHIDVNLAHEIFDIDLSTLPPERVKEELLKILMYSDGARKLWHFGLLYKIIPEMEELEIRGGQHHEEDVIEHSLLAFEYSCTLTDDIMLRLTCLLHDIGKGISFQEDGDNIHFKYHDNAGVELAREVLWRLKFSTRQTKYVCGLIGNHMLNVEKPKSYRRLFARLESQYIPVDDLVLLNYCDNQANLKNDRIKYHDRGKKSKLLEMYHKMKYSKDPFAVKDLEINGHDIMALGINSGEQVGKYLNTIFEMVCDGKIKNNRRDDDDRK